MSADDVIISANRVHGEGSGEGPEVGTGGGERGRGKGGGERGRGKGEGEGTVKRGE